MDRFQEMKVLLAVTEAESFAGGAKLLGISHAVAGAQYA
jgi:DNA-binding transcriptional LysR family regulator